MEILTVITVAVALVVIFIFMVNKLADMSCGFATRLPFERFVSIEWIKNDNPFINESAIITTNRRRYFTGSGRVWYVYPSGQDVSPGLDQWLGRHHRSELWKRNKFSSVV